MTIQTVFDRIINYSKTLFKSKKDTTFPEEDIHKDNMADVGDMRYYIQPMGEIMGYDVEGDRKRISVLKQVYDETAVYTNGNKHYAWKRESAVYEGPISDWDTVKNNPEDHFGEIPENWRELVKRVDRFIDKHGNDINKEDYRSYAIDLS